ncbi:WxL protein peptidoglycan domain-containing protein [Oerskovia paurometabola]|uniref:WxL protein peptidoglycan domain-containing protein n=1 Tax=Oerskovia paurometabola TaxID=162170 RepID=UPI003428EF0E
MDRRTASSRRRRGAAAVLAGVVAALLSTTPAGALEAPDGAAPGSTPVTWGVAPASAPTFDLALDPGATITDELVVTNRGDVPLDLAVYAADAFTSPTGALDVLPAGATSVDLGAWITADAARIEVGPGERATVPFTLTVPADATPGDHTAALVTSLVTEAGEGGVAVDRRLGTRVLAGSQETSLRRRPSRPCTPTTPGRGTPPARVTRTSRSR